MSDWFVPLIFGAMFYAIGTLRSRALAFGRPPNRLSRALRDYGTFWAVGEGYLMLGIRSMLDGTVLYPHSGVIVTVASLLWGVTVIATAITRGRQCRARSRY